MVKINKIVPQTVQLFDPSDNLMGLINEYEFADIRIQIKKNKIEGYYILYNNIKVFINSDGFINHWPDGLFDLLLKSYNKLLFF